ncbi:MAG TPA: S8 family serine peptidase [Cyclobacteriaceae bacterium]|nr:S8 family serine peptidase [Cyclobacteriaceae bacterium]
MKKVFFLILLLSAGNMLAQTPQQTLTEIANENKVINDSQKAKAEAYSRAHNVPLSFRDLNGNYIYLIGVDDFGVPIYRTTLNAGAAITTGVNQLRTGGSLGLNLEGEGMLIGVWDNDIVKDHVEFGGRRISNEGTAFSEHSTHVTGTLIAAGIQPNAKGMAPKAKATTWDFDNDIAEMASLARPDQSSLLVSNHSYGIVLGFFRDDNNNWQWAGNSGISANEDYRFGFYGSQSRAIDNLAFNAPYYTMVWAAGNDRTDVGDGSHPPDGNGGYDLLGPEGVAKNNISVGAVQKVTNYTAPSSVVMSNFSSWGPTDDGRIKPDLVGAGVSIYSTTVTSGGADSYGTQSGTSMASPNVAGSLLLLQELHRDLNAGNFMRAATLKALAIHTAKEAGLNPGPDYSFGWGLLDVEAAAKVLLSKDQQSVVVMENTLQNGGVFDFNFEPQQNTKVTATIAWTDPPGSPPSATVDPSTRMLVNDLDIKIFDSGNNTVLPWKLSPANPSAAATRGDNNVDNVEKIEFSNPEPRLYTLRVSHKGATLENNQQNYSLILTFTPVNDPKTAYYWIGNSGNWNDASKWSLTSGGVPVNQVPDINSRVIVDENSFSAANQTISLTADATCGSLTWLAKSNASLSLNNHKLNIDGNLIVSVNTFTVSTNGQIELMGSSTSQNQLNLNGTDLSKVDLIINSANGASWTANGAINIGGITVQQGGLIAKGVTIKTKTLNANSASARLLDLSNTTMTDITQSLLNASNLELTTTALTNLNLAEGLPANITWTGIDFDGTLDTKTSQATLAGGATVNKLIVGNSLTINGNNTFGEFDAGAGAVINLQTGSTQNFTQSTALGATAANRISIKTVGGGTSTMNFDGHFKLCYDYLDINDVGINGDVKISAGTNSTLTNAANWYPGSCDEALFADFSFQFNCKGSLTEFTDMSDGNIQSWSWDFGDASSGQNTSTDRNPYHIFNNTGNYTVMITVSDADETETYTRQVSVVTNNLPANNVIIANQKLFSELTAEFYQWYKDGSQLSAETGRWYEFNGDPGAYFVVIKNNTCSLPSSTFVVTGEEEIDVIQHGAIYPNPAHEEINIELPLASLPAKVSLINALGQEVFSSQLTEQHSVITTGELEDGLYIIDISSKRSMRKKIIIKH